MRGGDAYQPTVTRFCNRSTSFADAASYTILIVLLQTRALGRSALFSNPNSEIETADSADFTDLRGVIGDERTNLFLVKLQGVYNCNLLYPCNLRNLRLNPFSVFGFSRSGFSSH
jgi:hypothetical protein